jgi:hypothetical protein
MSPRRPRPTASTKSTNVLSHIKQDQGSKQQGYREKALKLFPHVCGRCGREFAGRRLKELTVHHKDHNHENNPSDGSNWELLCIYCHDMEHQKYLEEDDDQIGGNPSEKAGSHKPFASLGDLLKKDK